ncbi:MAG: PKD domain-containing protein [Candidatus Bipolaricaulota bacterium]|nr:PKD domain-containing protein [Candidatus Bipolaricaulota bacterium]
MSRQRCLRVGIVLLFVALALGGCAQFFPLDARIGIRGSVEGPIPLVVGFTSVLSTGPVSSRAWDFGDPVSGPNNTSTVVAPEHTYAQHGAYLVTLTVFASDGRSSRATVVIQATNPPPVAILDATPNHGPAPLAVTFNLSHSIDPASIVPTPSGTLVSYSLDFGDGTPPAVGQDLGIPIIHAYATPEIRTATLTVVDDDGASATASRQIVVEGVVASLASPGPDPAGLTYDGSSLWVSDWTSKQIYKVRPSDGLVLAVFDAPGEEVAALDAAEKDIVPGPSTAGTPAGLAWQDGALWVACTSDGKLYKVNPNVPTTDPAHILAVLDSAEFTPLGLAYGGGALWVGDLGRGRIFKVDPWTGAVLGSFAAPGASPTAIEAKGIVAVAPIGLAWANGSLWVTAGATLVRVDPATGAILASTSAPGSSPTGLAFDGRTLWVGDPNGANPGRLDRIVVP